jgi:hypothetical protein
MPIPDFQSLMLPLLKSLADGQERVMQDVTAGTRPPRTGWRQP